jgi:hypothetical protein
VQINVLRKAVKKQENRVGIGIWPVPFSMLYSE